MQKLMIYQDIKDRMSLRELMENMDTILQDMIAEKEKEREKALQAFN